MNPLFSTPLEALARWVAASQTFRTLVGAPDAATALDRVYYQEARDDIDPSAPKDAPNYIDPLPRAIVFVAPGTRIVRRGPGTWAHPMQFGLAIQAAPPESVLGSPKDETRWFLDLIGQITQDLRDTSGGSDADGNPYLNASELAIENGPMPSDADFQLYFWGVDFRISTP